jgi:hypothetical protein
MCTFIALKRTARHATRPLLSLLASALCLHCSGAPKSDSPLPSCPPDWKVEVVAEVPRVVQCDDGGIDRRTEASVTASAVRSAAKALRRRNRSQYVRCGANPEGDRRGQARSILTHRSGLRAWQATDSRSVEVARWHECSTSRAVECTLDVGCNFRRPPQQRRRTRRRCQCDLGGCASSSRPRRERSFASAPPNGHSSADVVGQRTE